MKLSVQIQKMLTPRNEWKREQADLQEDLVTLFNSRTRSACEKFQVFEDIFEPYFKTHPYTTAEKALHLLKGCGCCQRHAHGLLMLESTAHCETWADKENCLCTCRTLARKLNCFISKDADDLVLGKWRQAHFSTTDVPFATMRHHALHDDRRIFSILEEKEKLFRLRDQERGLSFH